MLGTVLAWHDDEMGYQASVAATWRKSVERLGARPRTVLRLLAHLAPEPILVGLLEEGAEIVEASLPEHHPWVQLFRKNLDVLLGALGGLRGE